MGRVCGPTLGRVCISPLHLTLRIENAMDLFLLQGSRQLMVLRCREEFWSSLRRKDFSLSFDTPLPYSDVHLVLLDYRDRNTQEAVPFSPGHVLLMVYHLLEGMFFRATQVGRCREPRERSGPAQVILDVVKKKSWILLRVPGPGGTYPCGVTRGGGQEQSND